MNTTIESLMEEIFGVFSNTLQTEFINMPIINITIEQMNIIINEAKRLGEENIAQYYQEDLNIELMELMYNHYVYDFCCINDVEFAKYIYNIFFNDYGITILKYIYTFYVLYSEYNLEKIKTVLLNLLIEHYKNDIIHQYILTRQNNVNNEDVKIILNEETFNNLETFKITENINDNCAICLNPFEINDDVIKLNCTHIFHKDCIKMQLCNYSNKCPNCKTEVIGGKPNL